MNDELEISEISEPILRMDPKNLFFPEFLMIYFFITNSSSLPFFINLG